MVFPINTKSEGRVLVPWEHRKYPNMTLQDSSGGIDSMLGEGFSADWQGESNVWEAYRRTCPPNSPARRLFSSVRPVSAAASISKGNLFAPQTNFPSGGEFAFATQTGGKFDFCENPWAHNIQGHFFSDWRTIPVLYPVFSPAKGKGFSDIRIPSHYYYGSTPRYTYGWDPVNMDTKIVDDNEVPWEKKSDKIFWRGATTGGGSSPPGFAHQYQRHRFVFYVVFQHPTYITFSDSSVWRLMPQIQTTPSRLRTLLQRQISSRRKSPHARLMVTSWTSRSSNPWDTTLTAPTLWLGTTASTMPSRSGNTGPTNTSSISTVCRTRAGSWRSWLAIVP